MIDYGDRVYSNPPDRKNSNSSVSRGTNTNPDFSLIWICTEYIAFLDLVGFGGAAFSVESACHKSSITWYYIIQNMLSHKAGIEELW